MGLERIVSGQMDKPGFGSHRYFASMEGRPHISLSKIVSNDNAEFVKLGEEKEAAYRGWEGRRYFAAENLTYDLFLAFYDPDSGRLWAWRFYDAKGIGKRIESIIGSAASKGHHIEARIIGLQDLQGHLFLRQMMELLHRHAIKLVEADLFGREVRHIAIDLKTGSSYTILPGDRDPGPGELVNHMTLEDFHREFILHQRA